MSREDMEKSTWGRRKTIDEDEDGQPPNKNVGHRVQRNVQSNYTTSSREEGSITPKSSCALILASSDRSNDDDVSAKSMSTESTLINFVFFYYYSVVLLKYSKFQLPIHSTSILNDDSGQFFFVFCLTLWIGCFLSNSKVQYLWTQTYAYLKY